MRAVPMGLRDAGYALGYSRFRVATRVVIPAALSSITAAFILEVLAVERAASNLERVGDKAKSIAKRCLALNSITPQLTQDSLDLLHGLQRAVTRMLADSVAALARRSFILAADVEGRDAEALLGLREISGVGGSQGLPESTGRSSRCQRCRPPFRYQTLL